MAPKNVIAAPNIFASDFIVLTLAITKYKAYHFTSESVLLCDIKMHVHEVLVIAGLYINLTPLGNGKIYLFLKQLLSIQASKFNYMELLKAVLKLRKIGEARLGLEDSFFRCSDENFDYLCICFCSTTILSSL